MSQMSRTIRVLSRGPAAAMLWRSLRREPAQLDRLAGWSAAETWRPERVLVP